MHKDQEEQFLKLLDDINNEVLLAGILGDELARARDDLRFWAGADVTLHGQECYDSCRKSVLERAVAVKRLVRAASGGGKFYFYLLSKWVK